MARILAAPRLSFPGLLRLLSLASVAGTALLLFTLLSGFEEPHPWLLVISVLLLISPPICVLGHLWTTHELAPAEKRAWLREFTGKRMLRALSEYIDSSDRAERLRRFQRDGRWDPAEE